MNCPVGIALARFAFPLSTMIFYWPMIYPYIEREGEREREREGKVGVVTILLNLPEIIGREYVFVNTGVCLWQEE